MKFRRQYPIGHYIVDYICVEAKLIIEADGGQHSENIKDSIRTQFLESEGYKVVRFWNNDIIENMDGVLQKIQQTLIEGSNPHLNPLPKRERRSQAPSITSLSEGKTLSIPSPSQGEGQGEGKA
jgi:hypothetical protein